MTQLGSSKEAPNLMALTYFGDISDWTITSEEGQRFPVTDLFWLPNLVL